MHRIAGEDHHAARRDHDRREDVEKYSRHGLILS
jgi:hypothetical protein